VLIAAAGLLAAGSATPHPATSLQDGEVSDATGDSGPAPDITTINLSHDNSGNVTWKVRFANRTLLVSPDFFQIIIDADLRGDTGPDGGFEWLIQAELPFGTGLFKWDGSAYQKVGAGLTFTADVGEVTAEIDFRDLGSQTVRFWIYADTLPVNADDFSDEAPEEPASYLFQVLVPLLLDSFVPPKTVKAGKRLSVAVGVWTNNDVSPAISCRARLGRKTLTGKASWTPTAVPSPLPNFTEPISRKGRASCAFAVPRTARGKTLAVTIVLTKEGETLRKVFSKKIR
jgi:hypothetical protein